ncbi:MAG: hypothetical protein WBC33_10820, partial [Conexibacter sp.]
NIALAPPGVSQHVQLTFDEAMAVLNGRSPLVNYTTTYGALIPYLIAIPLKALGASLAAFMTLMTVLNALALLAVYAVLRRLTRNAPAALALYVPFVATSVFWVRGTFVSRYDFGNYFGVFPLRYAGPLLLLWATLRHLDGDRPRRPETLYALSGLVMLNNTDFGVAAFCATVGALLVARPPPDRRELLRRCRPIATGLAIAFGLVSILTLVRAGSLPHLDVLVKYARIFGVAGWGNLHTPLFGFHLVIYATFVAGLATAAARFAARHPDVRLTAMLAWSSLFGLVSGAYFAYRSHPDVLIAHFPAWALTLALLVIVVARAVAERVPRRVTIPDVAVLLGFALAVCSLAQFPSPWQQRDRIEQRADTRPLDNVAARRFVMAQTEPGEPIALPTALGHRIAYESGVVNVVGYADLVQMPTVEQWNEMLAALCAEGGSVLIGGFRPEMEAALHRNGFRRVRTDADSGLTLWVDERGCNGGG